MELNSMRILITILFSSFVISISAQTGPDTYWVQFTDKDATPFTIGEPQEYLSERSITRRQNQGISIDESDLPVDPVYISAVLATGDVQLINRSKWFNAVTIRTSDTDALDAIEIGLGDLHPRLVDRPGNGRSRRPGG